jgi:putative Ca2+/H+ antiporter (TMEM165/GDT1 family)
MEWNWKVFAATFAALFVAELGDKTQLAVISLSTDSKKPLSVFVAAVLALALVTLIGVLFGEALVRIVPAEYLKRAAAVLFVVIGGLMWFKVI